MELRKDYILERWVYIATDRKKRPQELVSAPTHESKTCFFCAGNEFMTPEEIGRIKNEKGWQIRWFLNKFPAVELSGKPEVKTDNTFFTYSPGYGKHEIIADSPNHSEQLWDLSEERLVELVNVYIHRINELSRLPGINYVSVFKNHGKEGGASLAHSHTQVTAVSMFPKEVSCKIKAVKQFGSCAYCRVIEIEKGSLRRCFENDKFVAFAPYASRFNYEVWIFPKNHMTKFQQLGKQDVEQLAQILSNVLKKLKSINAAYNYYLHYGDGLHLHIEVVPRLGLWAGFEYSTGHIINSVSPEDAAAFYRGEL